MRIPNASLVEKHSIISIQRCEVNTPDGVIDMSPAEGFVVVGVVVVAVAVVVVVVLVVAVTVVAVVVVVVVVVIKWWKPALRYIAASSFF